MTRAGGLHARDTRRHPRRPARRTSRREQDHVRTRRPARAQRPPAHRHRGCVPRDGGRPARGADMRWHRPASSSLAIGLDPLGPRARVVDAPRYRAMEHYFDAHWPEGRTMMRNTASIQVNLDIGRELEIEMRWKRAHDLGPVLAAAFANSPLDAYGLAHRLAVDPARGLAGDRPGAHRLRVRARSRRAFVVDALHARRPGDDDPQRRRRLHATRRPHAVRRVDRQRSRARVAHARRLRATTSPRCSRRPPARLARVPHDRRAPRPSGGRSRSRWPRRCSTTPKPRTPRHARSRPLAVVGSPLPATGSPTPRCAPPPTRVSPPCSKRCRGWAPMPTRSPPPPSFCDRYVARGRSPADDVLREWNDLPAATPRGAR